MPAFALILWLGSTLSWWAFAFMPLPSDALQWLETARYVCFGPMDSGLPGASGWILLVVAPATFLVPMAALWGFDLVRSVGRLARSRAGQALFAVLAVALVIDGSWVVAKFRLAQRIASADAPSPDLPATLPPDYPRQSTVAPDFALVDQHGDTISLSRFKGRPVVLTFVFAHCQTMCPMLVQAIKRAALDAGPSEVLLVTLDPWRDTVSTLPAIARQWETPRGFHVLSSGRVADVLSVATAYNVPFERDEKTGDIVHPGLVFVIDAGGRMAFTFNNPPAAWVKEALDRLGSPYRKVS
jgi:cytochrome oxidase Cu insertion factor (SCO1/SenC/PrrC family)